MSSERDAISLVPEPSFFGASTPEMRKAGAKILIKGTEGMEPELGIYVAQGLAAEIFSAMLAVKERTAR